MTVGALHACATLNCESVWVCNCGLGWFACVCNVELCKCASVGWGDLHACATLNCVSVQVCKCASAGWGALHACDECGMEKRYYTIAMWCWLLYWEAACVTFGRTCTLMKVWWTCLLNFVQNACVGLGGNLHSISLVLLVTRTQSVLDLCWKNWAVWLRKRDFVSKSSDNFMSCTGMELVDSRKGSGLEKWKVSC